MKVFQAIVGWVCAAMMLGCIELHAQTPEKPVTASPEGFSAVVTTPLDSLDSLQRQRHERIERGYDSLRVKSDRRWFSRTLYKALFRSVAAVDERTRGEVRDETALTTPYAGYRIGEIRIVRRTPFDSNGNWFERAANNTHMLTRERIIRRDLLFKTGDRLDPQIIARNKQLLQSRPYIADVMIEVVPDPDDAGLVHLLIVTRDSWTIDVDGRLSGGEGSLGISEANLFGRGHELRIETNLNVQKFDYGGNVLEYKIPNLWGSFYQFESAVGRRFDDSFLEFGVTKEFLRPKDYELGVTYAGNRFDHTILASDTTVKVKSRDFNLWTGYSHPIGKTNGFIAARYNYRRFTTRPEDTDVRTHPDLHCRNVALVSLGLYHERFYSSDMIYSYGTREYLASGYKSDLTFGYQWGEFSDDYYLGTSQMVGGFIDGVGFLKGGLEVGSFIDTKSGHWHRTTLSGMVGWFSNLWHKRRTHYRQFASLGYTQGWNRFMGSCEVVEFTKEHGLNVLEDGGIGLTRLVLNTETIFFTPYEPLGFRTVLFGFVDAGLLGMHANVFRNDAYAAIGCGVRFRNERLVIGTIQIRLGVAFGPGGLAESKYFRLTRESSLPDYRFNPERPDFVTFR